MTYEIHFWGQFISKKNLYQPMTVGKGKNQRTMFIKNAKLQNKIDVLSLQIPGEMRGLMLENPDLRLEMTVAHASGDRDGAYTTLLDILRDAKVIYNDNMKRGNGKHILEPVVLSDHWKTVVTLTTTQPTTGSLFQDDTKKRTHSL